MIQLAETSADTYLSAEYLKQILLVIRQHKMKVVKLHTKKHKLR